MAVTSGAPREPCANPVCQFDRRQAVKILISPAPSPWRGGLGEGGEAGTQFDHSVHNVYPLPHPSLTLPLKGRGPEEDFRELVMAKKRPTKIDACDATKVGAASGSARLAKLDREIVALLNERAALVEAAAKNGKAAPAAMTDLAVLDAAVKASAGPLPAAAVEAVFRELLSGIRAANQPVRVAYLGPEFTYSHLAAIARFVLSAELVPVATIAAVFGKWSAPSLPSASCRSRTRPMAASRMRSSASAAPVTLTGASFRSVARRRCGFTIAC
jgi:chorismate mutase